MFLTKYNGNYHPCFFNGLVVLVKILSHCFYLKKCFPYRSLSFSTWGILRRILQNKIDSENSHLSHSFINCFPLIVIWNVVRPIIIRPGHGNYFFLILLFDENCLICNTIHDFIKDKLLILELFDLFAWVRFLA